jgi:hypothetical protein
MVPLANKYNKEANSIRGIKYSFFNFSVLLEVL